MGGWHMKTYIFRWCLWLGCIGGHASYMFFLPETNPPPNIFNQKNTKNPSQSISVVLLHFQMTHTFTTTFTGRYTPQGCQCTSISRKFRKGACGGTTSRWWSFHITLDKCCESSLTKKSKEKSSSTYENEKKQKKTYEGKTKSGRNCMINMLLQL